LTHGSAAGASVRCSSCEERILIVEVRFATKASVEFKVTSKASHCDIARKKNTKPGKLSLMRRGGGWN